MRRCSCLGGILQCCRLDACKAFTVTCALAQFHYWADFVAFNAFCTQLFAHFKDKGLSNFNSQARGQDLSLKSSAFKQLKFLVYCCCS